MVVRKHFRKLICCFVVALMSISTAWAEDSFFEVFVLRIEDGSSELKEAFYLLTHQRNLVKCEMSLFSLSKEQASDIRLAASSSIHKQHLLRIRESSDQSWLVLMSGAGQELKVPAAFSLNDKLSRVLSLELKQNGSGVLSRREEGIYYSSKEPLRLRNGGSSYAMSGFVRQKNPEIASEFVRLRLATDVSDRITVVNVERLLDSDLIKLIAEIFKDIPASAQEGAKQ